MNLNEINLMNELSKSGYVLLLVDENDVRILNMKMEEIVRFDIIESDLYLSAKEFIDIQTESNEVNPVKKSFKKEIFRLEEIIKNREVFGGEIDILPSVNCEFRSF